MWLRQSLRVTSVVVVVVVLEVEMVDVLVAGLAEMVDVLVAGLAEMVDVLVAGLVADLVAAMVVEEEEEALAGRALGLLARVRDHILCCMTVFSTANICSHSFSSSQERRQHLMIREEPKTTLQQQVVSPGQKKNKLCLGRLALCFLKTIWCWIPVSLS
jgi:hypothetical protein